MTTMKFSRTLFTLIAVVFALVMAACSPSASPTTAPDTGETTAPGGSDAAGEPADAVKAFYNALFSGGDAAAYVCNATGVDAAKLQETYKQVASAFANSNIDTTGLTFTASNVTADKADVAVNGSMSVETSGVKTDLPMAVGAIPVVKEGDSWKICG